MADGIAERGFHPIGTGRRDGRHSNRQIGKFFLNTTYQRRCGNHFPYGGGVDHNTVRLRRLQSSIKTVTLTNAFTVIGRFETA